MSNGTVSKVNDVLCITISKIDNRLKSSVKKIDDITFCASCIEGKISANQAYSYYDCCYPYGLISGTSGAGGLTVCFNTDYSFTNVTATSPQVICDTSILTRCCVIQLGYDSLDYLNACGAEPSTYYLSVPCLTSKCDLTVALGIYTNASCTSLAIDGYYSDGTNYGSVSGGVFTFGGTC